MTPWSVRAIAGISSSAARATMAGMRLAPSSSEYSVWLWRWTKLFGACGIVLVGLAETPRLVYPPGRRPPVCGRPGLDVDVRLRRVRQRHQLGGRGQAAPVRRAA